MPRFSMEASLLARGLYMRTRSIAHNAALASKLAPKVLRARSAQRQLASHFGQHRCRIRAHAAP